MIYKFVLILTHNYIQNAGGKKQQHVLIMFLSGIRLTIAYIFFNV